MIQIRRGVCRYLVPIIATYAIFFNYNANAGERCGDIQNKIKISQNSISGVERKLLFKKKNEKPGTKVTGLLLDIAKTELERLVNEYEKCVQQESSFMIKKNN
jgi:hypothetical protein|tara:strand:+ start:279 stop:587 length:309 start_codon:yes stop_codon:yes gene_type:complete